MSSQPGRLTSLGSYKELVESAVQEISAASVVSRIWDMDHTVWKNDPQEIVNRLGWLKSPEIMKKEIAGLDKFVEQIRREGFKQCVLMGMGGSSMAPEVYRYTFGVADGFPDLIVLDTTDPDALGAVAASINLETTLFVVATKSGGTAETLSMMKYFYNELDRQTGAGKAGNHFVAITDPGSKLVTLSGELGFRKTFLNDANIGGRYSALSFFGLVPAALVGVQLETLLQRAAAAAERCRAANSPAVHFGTAIGELAGLGRDKLTLVLSPGINHFGAWAEQLVAESLGKEGVGVLPVDGELLLAPDNYLDDRLFVYLQLSGETQLDNAVKALGAAGHPVVHLTMEDAYDLGGEYFNWEFATVIAAERMGINPFDQPNVESAKVQANKMLAAYQESGQLPQLEPALQDDRFAVFMDSKAESLEAALPAFLKDVNAPVIRNGAMQYPYVSIHAYLEPGAANEVQLRKLQHVIQKHYKVATTFGYGPRFLHSTGQLHKGDAGLGRFIQITADPRSDLAIPDEPGSAQSSASFAVLKSAQALGDRQALIDNKRKVIRFHIRSNVTAILSELVKTIG